MLSWRDTGGTENYWVYGKAGDAYFVPALLPPYTNRLAVLPYGSTSWSSASGVGDPASNWTYLVVAVDASNQEVCRSERAGEHDYNAAIAD